MLNYFVIQVFYAFILVAWGFFPLFLGFFYLFYLNRVIYYDLLRDPSSQSNIFEMCVLKWWQVLTDFDMQRIMYL